MTHLNTGRTATLCIAFLFAAGTSHAQPFDTIERGHQNLGTQLVASQGWAIATFGTDPLDVLVVNLETGAFTPLDSTDVELPVYGFALLENGFNTTALLVGQSSASEINMAPDRVQRVRPLTPGQPVTVFGVADLGSDLYNVGGFAEGDFVWLGAQLNSLDGDPAPLVPNAMPSAGIAGGDNSVIVGTTIGPLRIGADNTISTPLVVGAVTALTGNLRRGRALVYEIESTEVLARILSDDSVAIISTEGIPRSRDELATAAELVLWVDRSNAMAPIIQVVPAGAVEVGLSIDMPTDFEGSPGEWATRIATDGDYLVAASPGSSRLDLFDLRCFAASGRSCPMGSECSDTRQCTPVVEPGPDAGPSDAGPSDAGADARVSPDATAEDSGTAGGDSGMVSPRAELSCTCRAAGTGSSGRLPFALGGLLLLVLVRRRRTPMQ